MNVSETVLSTIETSLRSGNRLHAFLSGGGLRVFRVEDTTHILVGYGEHPHAEDAMRILADDLSAGGREYGSVYGPIETPYLTGTSTPNEGLDAWIRAGQTFDAHAEGDMVVALLRGFQHTTAPEDVVNRALSGEVVQWRDSRGYEFESCPSRFPNGEACVSTSCLSKTKNGADAWMWRSVQRGEGKTLREAIQAALAATAVEEEHN